MASHSNTPHWEAPKFSFSMPQQSEEVFYTRVTGFLKALDIDTEEADSMKKRVETAKNDVWGQRLAEL